MRSTAPNGAETTTATSIGCARLIARAVEQTMSNFDNSEAVRRHTKCRGKNVTTRWQDVARDLFAENAKLRSENERRKKRMQWYDLLQAANASDFPPDPLDGSNMPE